MRRCGFFKSLLGGGVGAAVANEFSFMVLRPVGGTTLLRGKERTS